MSWNIPTFVFNEDSNQPEHLCSLIRVSIVHVMKLCIHGYPKWVKILIRLYRLIWVLTNLINYADPDQLASSEANWSGSTLFAKPMHIQIQQDQGKG